MVAKYSNNEFLERVKQCGVTNIEIIDEYKTSRQKIKVRCKIDGYEWMIGPAFLLMGQGCPKCSCAIPYTIDTFKEKALKIHPNIEILSPFVNTYTPIAVKCLRHDYHWKPLPKSLLSGSGCPHCKYKNQGITNDCIREIFKVDLCSTHIYSNGCEVRKQIRPDFFFKYRDKSILIEYNGAQHFKPIAFNKYSIEKSKENFRQQVIRDVWLKNYCDNNGIMYFEIDGRKVTGIKIREYIKQIKDTVDASF